MLGGVSTRVLESVLWRSYRSVDSAADLQGDGLQIRSFGCVLLVLRILKFQSTSIYINSYFTLFYSMHILSVLTNVTGKVGMYEAAVVYILQPSITTSQIRTHIKGSSPSGET